ncbi:hypothetical protein [Streptomyces griseosporeus]|uniref:hypothetical protein n=1 Tax=Streptomyces griseosporeus TaxID=1910 RepID=UPI003701C723
MSAPLQHQLHSRIELAAQMLGLPLTPDQLERLALELTPWVKARLAEQADAHAAAAPIAYAVVPTMARPVKAMTGMETTRYAGCVSRVGLDVDLDSPAATLAAKVRRQPDAVATEVPDAHTLAVTVRPSSLPAWRWWLSSLSVDLASVQTRGTAVIATGRRHGVTVQLRGEGVPALLSDKAAARLAGFLSGEVR